MKITTIKTPKKVLAGLAVVIACGFPWSGAQADMGKYRECRKQAFLNMFLSKAAPFMVLSLASEMNDCIRHLTPEERKQVEKERAEMGLH